MFIEKECAPLTNKMESRIKDTGNLLDIIDNINQKGLSTDTLLVSFDIVNMFPNIDNERGIQTVKTALDNRLNKKTSTLCLIEGLTICLYCNNSIFNNTNILQTNGTATGAPNSCSYSDLAVQPIDNAIFEEKENNFTELNYYGRYRDDCLVLWNGTNLRLEEFHNFLNSLDTNLQFTMEIGGSSLNYLQQFIVNQRIVICIYKPIHVIKNPQ